MKAIATALLCSLAVALVGAIFGGDIVPQGTKKYMASLRQTSDGDTICGGTLITPFHVLTTATCIGQKSTVVAVGTHYFNDTLDGEHILIASYHCHPLFDFTSLRHDLAIVTLAKPSKCAPIQLPKFSESDRTAKAEMWTFSMGWGTTDRHNQFGHSEVLRSVELVVWKTENCKEATSLSSINNMHLCAGGEEGKGVAFGDQGGPLIEKGDDDDVLIGVLSHAVGSADKDIPSVYTRVSTELTWIIFFLKRQGIIKY